MIDVNKLKSIIIGYKNYFPLHFYDEKYKWEAIKHFQDHWDIDADNFGDMFKVATEKTKNLLASGYAYPRAMIINFAIADDEAVRAMFKELYDESIDLESRIMSFLTASEEMRVKYDDGNWRNHYQNTNAVSTYLWLRYPDKYYIYKYELNRAVAKELSFDFIPRKNGSADNLLAGIDMYNAIREVVKADPDIRSMFQEAITSLCYPDPELITVTMDLGFYLTRFYREECKTKQNDEEWFPKDYSPNLSVSDWMNLLNDTSVFNESSLQIIARMEDFGGQATCKQLSTKYGETANFYNVGSSTLARRIAEKTGCPILTTDEENTKWWPILFVGREANGEIEGDYVWKLRDELRDALVKTDLSNVELYAKTSVTVEPEIRKYSKTDFLNAVYMAPERYDVLVDLLRNKKNIILQGAPGVGKTFSAKRLAYAMMGEVDDSRIEMVQFHQNYSYEDFIMGYRPNGADFKLTEGIFFRFCCLASKNPDKDFFFIIDEINRGNMSKIFGELLMLIEKDYRGVNATLVYSGKPFSVPNNLYIIGMMNTADRSLAMIDYALRRRFSFFEMEPGFNSVGFVKYQKSFSNETFDSLIEQIKLLNKKIAKDNSLGRGFQIGHSYFCGRGENECTEEWMRSIVEFDILPTLSEYWFDDPTTLSRWEKDLRGVFDD